MTADQRKVFETVVLSIGRLRFKAFGSIRDGYTECVRELKTKTTALEDLLIWWGNDDDG